MVLCLAGIVPPSTAQKGNTLFGENQVETIKAMKKIVKAIGVKQCTYCHVKRGGKPKFVLETPNKEIARHMKLGFVDSLVSRGRVELRPSQVRLQNWRGCRLHPLGRKRGHSPDSYNRGGLKGRRNPSRGCCSTNLYRRGCPAGRWGRHYVHDLPQPQVALPDLTRVARPVRQYLHESASIRTRAPLRSVRMAKRTVTGGVRRAMATRRDGMTWRSNSA